MAIAFRQNRRDRRAQRRYERRHQRQQAQQQMDEPYYPEEVQPRPPAEEAVGGYLEQVPARRACEDRVDVGQRGGINVIHGGMGVEASRKTSLISMYRRGVASTSQVPPPVEEITFSEEDMPKGANPFQDAVVIQAAIENFTVGRILVDNGSSVNLVFKKAFESMDVAPARITASDGPLFGFSGERKEVEGGAELLVTVGGMSKNCRFVIVDAPSSYNAIFGRPLLASFQAVASSFHQCLKYSSGGVQIRIRSDPRIARECYLKAVNSVSWEEEAEEMGRILEKNPRL